MGSLEQTSDTVQTGEENRQTFDEYLQQLPASKQSVHRWVRWLVALGFFLTLGVLVYAIFASFMVGSVGESTVVLAWMTFFFTGALFAFLLGLDTLIVGATIPLPFERSKYDFGTGRAASQTGWALIGYGVVVTALYAVGVAAVQAGRFGVEDWVSFIVGMFVILGLVSAALAVLRRILQPR